MCAEILGRAKAQEEKLFEVKMKKKLRIL